MGYPYVRQLISDNPVSEIFTATGDGVTTLFLLPNTPIVAGSEVATVNGIPTTGFTVNESSGAFSFTAAPANNASIAIAYSWLFFSDAALQIFLDNEGEDLRAAAAALDAMASNQAIVLKKMKLLDLETDGPSVAKALRDHATALRKQAASFAGVDWAEMVTDEFAWQERVWDSYLRTGT